MSEIKLAFKKAVNGLWPAGVHHEQLTDVVKVFVMGWVEAMNRLDPEAAQMYLGDVEVMCNPKWQADDSWRWW